MPDLGTIASDTGTGAGTGAMIGGPYGALIGGGIGLIGGLLTSSNTQQNSVGAASGSATAAQGSIDTAFGQYNTLVGAGPGQSDVANAYQSSIGLAQLFQQYSQTGGLPSAADTTYATGVSKNLYAGQQAALNNAFVQQTQEAQQRAAALGRSPDDPVLAAKLAIAKTQQQGVLAGQEQGTAQQLALSLPGQRLQYAIGGNNVLQGLAGQAFANRAAIISQGNQIVSLDNNLRVHAGSQVNTTGGGAGNAFAGAIGGLAYGPQIAQGLNGMFGGGGASAGGGYASGLSPASNAIAQNGWSVTGGGMFAGG
jgi:hypothetical protein